MRTEKIKTFLYILWIIARKSLIKKPYGTVLKDVNSIHIRYFRNIEFGNCKSSFKKGI